MSEATEQVKCIWRGRENPRALQGRHVAECEASSCPGCQPCEEPHCLVCGIEHKLGACPKCTGVARDHLWELVRLTSRVRNELLARPMAPKHGALEAVPGGELMFLAGPVADIAEHSRLMHEAWLADEPHFRDELDADGEPPRLTINWWEEKWRHLRGEETEDLASARRGADYLDSVLTWAADFEPMFADFARDLRQQVTRVEDALLDGIRPETGAPCLRCGKNQIKEFGEVEADDRWRCPNCNRPVETGEYERSVANQARQYADKLTASDMEIEYRIKPGTLTGWVSKGLVRRRGKSDSGRQLYDVKQALAQRDKASKDDEGDAA